MNDPFLFQRNNAAELFIVRHADAIPEEDEIIPSGIYDDLPLSRTGRRQAQALAERLSGLSFDAIYRSPLRRRLKGDQVGQYTPTTRGKSRPDRFD